MTSPSDVALSKKQLRSIARSRQRKIALWIGAVSAGKTVAANIAFFLAVRHTTGAGLIVIIGKTLQTIERNIIEPMQNADLYGELASHVQHTRGSNMAVILGRQVHLVGANDSRSEEKIRGATVELAYVDEATLLPVGFWEMLQTRLRVPTSRLLATTNPGASQHWLRISWILLRHLKNMIVFHFTMDDNPSLTAEYIRDMKASFTGVFYQRFIEGKWTNAEGAIYDGWAPAKHVIAWEQMPPMRRLLAVSMDFGTQHPSSVGILGLGYDRRLYMVDELRIETDATAAHNAPSQQAKMIADWLKLPHLPENTGLQPERMIADQAALAHRRELYETQGIATEGAVKDVSYGIGLISSLLAREIDGIPMLRVSDRCTGIVKEAPGYVWDAKKSEHGEDEPVKDKDDSMDMWRYAIATTENDWRDELLTISTAF